MANSVENKEVYYEVVKICKDLRNIEDKVRNTAAHQIVSITDEFIENKTGFNSEDIVKKLKKALEYCGINIKSEYWNSYLEMNKSIIEIMEN